MQIEINHPAFENLALTVYWESGEPTDCYLSGSLRAPRFYYRAIVHIPICLNRQRAGRVLMAAKVLMPYGRWATDDYAFPLTEEIFNLTGEAQEVAVAEIIANALNCSVCLITATVPESG